MDHVSSPPTPDRRSAPLPSAAEACALRAALDEREVAHAMLALARLLKYGAAPEQSEPADVA